MAAGVAGRWPSRSEDTATTTGASALGEERRRHYAALVAGVVALEGGRAGRGYVKRATMAFAGWYERNAGLRPMADLVLDEVASAGGARRLLTHGEADADPRFDSHFGTLGNRRRVLAGEAFVLAGPPYAPDRG